MFQNPLLRCLAPVVAAVLIWGGQALAYETHIVADSAGKPMFEVRFFNLGEQYNEPEEDWGNFSSWQLTGAHKNAVLQATRLWADTLGPASANMFAAPVNVGTYSVENADAGSEVNPAWQGTPLQGMTMLAGALIGNQYPDIPAQIRVGTLPWSIPERLSPVPLGPGADLVTTLYHEFGHALGISSLAEQAGDGSYNFENVSVWDTHLYDQYGTQAEAGMKVFRPGTGGTPGEDFFVGDLCDSGVIFQGGHVTEVLNGALPGLPVEGFEGSDLDLSHIELERSLMSHQNYRNFTTLMEAELAAMQDIGYTIDRRNFYGFSVYNSGLTLISHNGYFARNAAGTAYLPGQANTATLGVGLHIYGKNNDVTQAADLLAGGMAGTGVRVDGSGNTLRLDPGVRVAADGTWGTGLLVAYGKDQTVISRGTVQALGSGGVGARFDFGSNAMDNASEYRGSWLWEVGGVTTPLPADGRDQQGFDLNLDGPLVSRFDVSGPLAGSAAAVYIAQNAYVGEINIMSGASLRGDIVSDWNPLDPRIQYESLTGNSNTDLTTALRFGRLPAADGAATDAADPDFRLRYDGNILGGRSIRMGVDGGVVSFNGRAEVLDVEVEEGATLGGNAEYVLNPISDAGVTVGGTFLNKGTVSPGNSLGVISISGNYVQTPGARLFMEFDASSRTDRLNVSGTATLDGSLAISPIRDYYQAPISFGLTDMISTGGALSGSALTARPSIAVVSPTLKMGVSASGTGAGVRYTVITAREADAYSRYAADGDQREVARVFDRLGQTDARGDARELLAALDFSAPDGSQLPNAYAQLGPDVYNRDAEASLSAQRDVSSVLLNTRLLREPVTMRKAGLSSGDAAEERRFFLTPLGGTAHSDGDKGWNGNYGGILAGLETDRAAADGLLTLGAHATFTYRETSFSGSGLNRTQAGSFAIGGHGRYTFDAVPGAYLFGQIRAGLESAELRRSVEFNGYTRRTKADWLSPFGTLLLGGGRDFRPLDGLTLGPVAWLDYSAVWRPSVTEHGGGAIDLHLDDQYSQSLRSSLGGRIGFSIPVSRGTLEAGLTAVWNHEFLSDYGRARARFADYDELGFSRTAGARDRDTASVALSLNGRMSETFDVTLAGGTDAGGHTNTAWGGLQCRWTF